MLHAITQRKTGFHRRYLGHRDGSEARVHEEDELTALLLGPLALLPQSAVANFWAILLKRFACLHPLAPLPEGRPLKGEMKFWPSRSRIEPDLEVAIDWSSGCRTLILVELKWRAPLSGDEQLKRQWTEYLSTSEQAYAYHVFIGKETSEAVKARNLDNVWGEDENNRLVPTSWFLILSILQTLEYDESIAVLQPWIEQILKVLHVLGIRPFSGFTDMIHPNLDWVDERAFWRDQV